MEALTPAQIDLRERAARFVDETLIPLELEAERNGGPLPPEKAKSVSTRARELGLVGGNHAVDVGGQGWSALDQVLVQEELGRNTNGVWWNMGGGYNVLAFGTPEQVERYLKPTLRGERADSYAVTEGGAGSDAGGIAGTAERTAAGWRIKAEKWFVTSGDVSDFDIVMVNVVDGDERLPTLFLVDRDRPGIEVIDDPPFAHSFPHGHPTLRYDCEVDADAVLGGDEMIGRGNDLQNEWFIEERIHIAARCVGAMRRLLAEAVEWAAGREQFGGRIYDFQGVSFPLADSAADCAAARLLTHDVARAQDAGADPKLVHGRAAMAKLFASEAAWRCADRCVQVHGGRGYMRTSAAERFLRELRVDRIWEGTSEIQRLIIARGLERRGVERMLLGDRLVGGGGHARHRHLERDLGALAGGRVDRRAAAGQLGPLQERLDAEVQTHAVCAAADPSGVEAAAVVAHRAAQHAVRHGDRDLEVPGPGVTAHVRDGLAHRPVGDLLDHERDRLRRDADADLQVGLATGLGRELAHSLRQALRRPQLEHQAAGAVGRGGQRLPGGGGDVPDGVGVGAADQPVECEERRGQHLHRVVVELGRDPAALLLLGPKQA